MTSAGATWSDLLAGTAAGGGWMPTWFDVLCRSIRGALSIAEAPSVEGMKSWVLVLGAPVLGAASRQELMDRLDAALERPEFTQFMRESAPVLTVDALASLAISSEDLAEMEPLLGKGPTAILADTSPLLRVYGGILAHLLASGEVALDEVSDDWHDVFYAPGVHSTVKRSLLGNARASAAMIAIAHALFQRQRLEPWLALALAETFRDELYLAVRLFACLPTAVDVPESLVPLQDRHDLDRLHAEVAANESLWNGVAGLAGDQRSHCDGNISASKRTDL